jgi:hypothetical protein
MLPTGTTPRAVSFADAPIPDSCGRIHDDKRRRPCPIRLSAVCRQDYQSVHQSRHTAPVFPNQLSYEPLVQPNRLGMAADSDHQ